MRKEIPLAVTFLAGTTIVLAYFFNIPWLKVTASSQVLNWAVIVAAFALALGAGSLTRFHVLNVTRRGKQWPYSIILLVALYGYLAYGLWKGMADAGYQWLFTGALVPGNSTVFSLNGFFIISAAYRTWRLRNWRAALLVMTAVIVVIGRVGLGQAIWPASGKLADWIMTYPNAAGMRGIVIGAALGTISLGLRIILGIDRGHLGAE
jgi:hypothetical protein